MTSVCSAPREASSLTLTEAIAYITRNALNPGLVGRVGIELEGHVIDLAVPGRRVPWSTVQAVAASLPALPGGSRVTLEPGGQIELSGPPMAGAADAVHALRADHAVLRAALADVGLGLALIGHDPLRPADRVNPGDRYTAMEEHFAANGCATAGTAMMASTAALQVNLDAGPPSAWANRVALAHQLGPVLVAISACSPLAGGRATGWQSSRQAVWGRLDQSRCAPLNGRDDPAGEWARYALAAPVMCVRNHATGRIDAVHDRIRFHDWVSGAATLADRRPNVDDLDYHLTTLFPPVRLRGYLEIRYLDAAPEPWWPALTAVTAALLDDPAASERAAAASSPVADAWQRAAHVGLADPLLHAAARACLDAALDAVPAALHTEVAALAALVDRGNSPGDDLLHTARNAGPTAVLLSATEVPS